MADRKTDAELIEHNRFAWNRLSDEGILWGIPVADDAVERARNGAWEVQLAGRSPVPHHWFGKDGQIRDRDILCLAAGGGQQAPLLSAAGARVTAMELSDAMLAKDREVARRHDLPLRCEQGSMTDLSRFANDSFDVIFLPVAICYVPDAHQVWQQCARVLRPGGRLLAGMINPLVNLFAENDGTTDAGLEVVHALPFVELETLSSAEREAAFKRRIAFVWSHTLTDLVGGQLSAGFRLLEFSEARRTDDRAPNINKFTNTYIMTAARLG
ncbi:MAG: class I SAM-dependent methyltransferase [Pseudomonadota bacterium]